jgi:hypothetical protein
VVVPGVIQWGRGAGGGRGLLVRRLLASRRARLETRRNHPVPTPVLIHSRRIHPHPVRSGGGSRILSVLGQGQHVVLGADLRPGRRLEPAQSSGLPQRGSSLCGATHPIGVARVVDVVLDRLRDFRSARKVVEGVSLRAEFAAGGCLKARPAARTGETDLGLRRWHPALRGEETGLLFHGRRELRGPLGRR